MTRQRTEHKRLAETHLEQISPAGMHNPTDDARSEYHFRKGVIHALLAIAPDAGPTLAGLFAGSVPDSERDKT